MESRGRISRVGVEGTGSYGTGLARHLGEADIDAVEVNRPNRQLRRRRGKDDHTDAHAAARAALSGEATAVPKSGDGPVEWIRMLTVARRSAVKARTQAANQIHSALTVAPEPLKAQLNDMNLKAQVRVCARFATQRRVHSQLRQTNPPAPSPPIPDPQGRNRGARCRDPPSLRQGQPGPPSRQRSRPRQRCRAADRSQRQPRADENRNGPSPRCVASAPSRRRQGEQFGIVSTGAATGKPTAHSGGSLPPGCVPTLPPNNTWSNDMPRARNEPRSSAASSGTSPHRSTG